MVDAETEQFTPGQTRKWLHNLLQETVRRNASDLFLKTDSPPCMRIDGRLRFLDAGSAPEKALEHVADLVLGARAHAFEEAGEEDVAYQVEGVGRFRVNVFRQRDVPGAAFRHIPLAIPSFEQLALPVEQLTHLSEQTRGIVLVTGVTGSGKSTTLAAMVEHMNGCFGRHVVTIEDPIEFVHRDKRCLIEQREVGRDTASFEAALRHVVRQSPDVILIGEMRDRVTIETALNAAEIGHLVLSTLHTATAVQTLERIVAYFPPHQHELVRTQIANTIQGVISQQLLVRTDGKGRAPAVELMMRSPTICDLIYKNETRKLRTAMREDSYYGSQTYNQALADLYGAGIVSMEAALEVSDRPQELKNELQGLRMG